MQNITSITDDRLYRVQIPAGRITGTRYDCRSVDMGASRKAERRRAIDLDLEAARGYDSILEKGDGFDQAYQWYCRNSLVQDGRAACSIDADAKLRVDA